MPELIAIIIFVSTLFLVSVMLKRNDIADVFWGVGIFIGVATAYITNLNKQSSLSLLVLFLIGIWAFRIFLHIGTRFIHKKEEDYRYKTWRETWKYFYTRSYLQVFLLQGIFMLCVGSSAITVFHTATSDSMRYSLIGELIIVVTSIAALAALAALCFEAVADLQLKKFLALKQEGKLHEEFLTTGLWSLTRHPNYFGEVSFWWCIFLLTTTIVISSQTFTIWKGLLLLLSPLTISYLILKVSGIPMLEKKNQGNKAWEAYAAKTPPFFPKLP